VSSIRRRQSSRPAKCTLRPTDPLAALAGATVQVHLSLAGGGGDGDQPDWIERGKMPSGGSKRRGPDSCAPDWHGDARKLSPSHHLPREVDPVVFHMKAEEADSTSYSSVGGLNEQIREMREVIELPLINPELFQRVGIKAPKGCLLYGPPGTGKTLLARAVSNNIDAAFLKVVASAIVDKYIGESARLIREMFGYARDHEPCIIFMDEIDAIGGRRFSEGTSADREIQRTLMELLNQLDGFDGLGKVKMICATNRPDVLDPALMRPGRLDRKIEIPLPGESARVDVLKIHAAPITKKGDIDYESVVKLADGFNAADLRNVCTEAGMFAIRGERDYAVEEDFMKAVRKVGENKKLEGKLEYSKV